MKACSLLSSLFTFSVCVLLLSHLQGAGLLQEERNVCCEPVWQLALAATGPAGLSILLAACFTARGLRPSSSSDRG